VSHSEEVVSGLRKAFLLSSDYGPALQRGDRSLGKRLAERDKAKAIIVGASMRKLLYICYGVLKNGVPFDPSLHPGT